MDEKDSKRPEDSSFKQQRLKAWQPLLTPQWVIGTFIIIAVIFIPIGAIVLSASRSIVEVSKRYDDFCPFPSTNCAVSITIPDDMEKPVFFYYQLDSFYQNHRRYVKSRSDTQLSGSKASEVSACDPAETNNGFKMYPCGLIASSFFNDSFLSLSGVAWSESGIAWQSDVDKKFKLASEMTIGGRIRNETEANAAGFTRMSQQKFELPSPTDEHFIVWMRTAGLPSFKKLYAKIDTNLKKGQVLSFNVTNVFNVGSFGGKKHIVLSTANWLGGKNDFLGVAFLVVGVLCLVLGISFFIKHKLAPRQLGDMHYLSWNAAPRNTGH